MDEGTKFSQIPPSMYSFHEQEQRASKKREPGLGSLISVGGPLALEPPTGPKGPWHNGQGRTVISPCLYRQGQFQGAP